jgi:glycerol kinase
MRSVLALDQGTTGSTALVISTDGQVLGRGYREFAQHFPQPGWVEHEPADLLQATLDAAREALAKSSIAPECIGITNQRETIVMWDKATGQPVHRAIVWQDRRTADRCVALADQKEFIAARTGLVLDAYFSATKIEWLLRTDASLARRAMNGELLCGTVDTWLIWKLTDGAVHATDPTNASRTMLYDIDKRAWSTELCELFGVPMAMLPEVRTSRGDFGVANARHLGVALPITGVAGDQQSALFGQGCVAPGEAKNTYGTGAFMLMNTGNTRPSLGDGLLTTIACDANGAPCYALEAAIFIAGAAVQWIRDGLGLIGSAADTEAMASGLASNDGVYFVPALTGLGAPHWEADARGTIVGLTRGTTRAHLVRAALEAMAYGTADVMQSMQQRSGVTLDALRVDGGASNNGWMMQFQADLLGVPVEKPAMFETTALGAAGLAGLHTGVWGNATEFRKAQRVSVIQPGAGAKDARVALAGWHRAVRATLSWARDSSAATPS